jgi:hypothetical protein
MTLVTRLDQIHVVVICYFVLYINNVLLLLLLLLLLLNATDFSLCGCNLYTSTDKTNKNK